MTQDQEKEERRQIQARSVGGLTSHGGASKGGRWQPPTSQRSSETEQREVWRELKKGGTLFILPPPPGATPAHGLGEATMVDSVLGRPWAQISPFLFLFLVNSMY
jgi:hypothetical protein